MGSGVSSGVVAWGVGGWGWFLAFPPLQGLGILTFVCFFMGIYGRHCLYYFWIVDGNPSNLQMAGGTEKLISLLTLFEGQEQFGIFIYMALCPLHALHAHLLRALGSFLLSPKLLLLSYITSPCLSPTLLAKPA